jgi:hypothetical protein
MGKAGGRFKAKVFVELIFFIGIQSTYALLAEIIKSGLKVVNKTDERSKVGFLGIFVYFIKKNIYSLLLKLYEFFDRSFY